MYRPARINLIALAVLIAIEGTVAPVVMAQTTLTSTNSVSQGLSAADSAANAAVLNISGSYNDVANRMNNAASYASNLRLQQVNSLASGPLKTTLQRMTCLDIIAQIKFIGLSKISFSSIIDAIINAALMALIRAACSLIEAAWGSAMNSLTQMTTIDMGSNVGSVSMIQNNGNSVSVSPSFSSSNPYLSQGMNAIQSSGTYNNQSYSASVETPALFGQPASTTQNTSPGFFDTISEKASSGWEATKNLFK